MKMWNAIAFVAFLSPYLSLVALTQVGVAVCILCCPRVAFCLRLTVAVQLPYWQLQTKFLQRIEANIEEHQSKDHDGFRPCTNVADAFAVLETVCSNSSEWNFPVWFVSVDSKKACVRLNIQHCLALQDRKVCFVHIWYFWQQCIAIRQRMWLGKHSSFNVVWKKVMWLAHCCWMQVWNVPCVDGHFVCDIVVLIFETAKFWQMRGMRTIWCFMQSIVLSSLSWWRNLAKHFWL